MHYLTEVTEIRKIVAKLALAKILWVDTEVADWDTPYPRLSLIQVLADAKDISGNSVYILDVLDKPELVVDFVAQIMINPGIEKIFHNASYDLKFLGKKQAQNVTCTLKLARKIGRDRLCSPDFKLKTLAAKLCQFTNIDTEEQASDWGRRPLSQKQLQYAKLDPVYLARLHATLLQINNPNKFKIEESGVMQVSEKSENNSFSPTKVRIAFECPRLFYLKQRFGGNTLFVPKERSTAIGNSFHKLAEEFIITAKREPRFKTLFEKPVEELNGEAIADRMQELFYELVFFPDLQKILKEDPSQAKALHQIWQGLTKLIRHWAKLLVKNRRHCKADAVIHSTLLTGEFTLEHNFTLPNGTQQQVIGRPDSLIFDLARNRFCVVELKTYHPADLSAQLAQVALYSYMLKEKKKVPVDSAVYCVLPEFKEYHYAWEELENTVHQIIPYKLQQMQQWLTWEPPHPDPPPQTTQPDLCNICPQQEKCQTFFAAGNNPIPLADIPKTSSQKKKVSDVVNTQKRLKTGVRDSRAASDSQSIAEANALGDRLVATLQSFGINVDYLGATVAPAFIRVKLKPQLGVKVNSLLKSSADLQVQLEIANPPLIAPQAGYVSVDLPRSNRQVAKFEDYIDRVKTPLTAPVKIAIGVNLDGKLVEADLSDPNACHFLVGGTTGSGKSEFLRSMLLSLLWRHPPKDLKIALVDPKRVTFPEFEQMPWLYESVVKEGDRAIELMSNLVAEMERRYQQFEAAGCANISAYNQQPGKILSRIVCIFDEYADFMAEKTTRDALELSIKRLGAMARAAGIHLIIATQRPEAKVVTPLIRSNLPGRVALRTASEADSAIVLGSGSNQKAAAYLLGKGDLLYQVGSHTQRLQSLLATEDYRNGINNFHS